MMKKVLLSVAFLFGIYFIGHAQNPLELYHNDVLLNDTILYYDDGNPDWELVFECNVKNTTSDVIRVGLIRFNIDTVPGTENSFCWAGSCLSAEIDTSNKNLVIPGGQSSGAGDFSGHYTANDKQGISIVKYMFFDISNPETSVSIVVKFKYSLTAVKTNSFKNSFSNAYPNPATNQVSFNYDLKNAKSASVNIINLLGSVVKSANLSPGSNKVSLDISDLTQGVYFYSIIVDGNINQTKKLIIK